MANKKKKKNGQAEEKKFFGSAAFLKAVEKRKAELEKLAKELEDSE